MNLTIEHLASGYRSGSLNPRRLMKDIHERCAQFDDHNIWIHLLSMQELEPYLKKLEHAGPDSLPLYGIPFAIKDNIDLAGIPTTAACPAFEYTPERSAFVVQQLIDAGAIPIGKTNMDQFATGLVGTRSPEPWGACKNAFDKAYISGGSSSGSAVSVALGLASFSLGTDTAGSGRVPAAFNNIVGLKPSRGLLSMSGVVPACRSLDCVSIFALTTDDADRVFEQAAVFDSDDAYARANTFDNNGRHYGLPVTGFSFAVPADDQLEFFADDTARELFQASVRGLQDMGGHKQEIDFTPFMQAARLLYEGPWVAERYVATEAIIQQQPESMLPVIRTIIAGAEGKTAMDGFRAEYEMQAYRMQAKAALSNIDFLLTPTAGTIYAIDEVNADPITLNSNLGYYTNFMNLLDCASVAVPAGFLDRGRSGGLPWGITLVSTALKDRKLLSFANAWQQHIGLAPGKLDIPLPTTAGAAVRFADTVPVIVCGAHLDGLALNWQLLERGAKLLEKTHTAARYRMYVIDGMPQRPGLVRDANDRGKQGGEAIEIEVWEIAKSEFGGFVAAIPEPLGIGKVETEDGRWLPGFICEGRAITGAREITALGGWRHYLAESEV